MLKLINGNNEPIGIISKFENTKDYIEYIKAYNKIKVKKSKFNTVFKLIYYIITGK